MSEKESKLVPLINIQVVLAFMVLQWPVIGYCDTANGWFSNLFESKSKNMKELVRTREIVIKDDSGFVPEPHAMSRSDDGGFIIAGRLGRAWAIKIDLTGKVLWRNLQDKPLSGGGGAADFTGAVSMPDGSSYLCGNMSPPPDGYTPSLLMHFDASGRLLDEQYFLPQKRSERGISYFDSCIRWGDDVVIVGHIHDIKRQASRNGSEFLPPITETSYWIIMRDAAGKIKWEKQIPTKFDVIDGAQSILVSDTSLAVAGYRAGKTELFRINKEGELAVSKTPMDGFFYFVRPVVSDGALQLYGYNPTDKAFELVTLNERLEEVHRAQGSREFYFGARFAYRLHDQSLVLFGAEQHDALYKPAAAYADLKLHSMQRLDLSHPAPFYETGYIDGVVPTGNDGEFVTIGRLLKHQPDEGRIGLDNVGLALDFIQVSKK